MENNNQQLKQDFDDLSRNEVDDYTLLEAEDLLSAARFDSQPASEDFRQKLFSQINEQRQEKKHMSWSLTAWFEKNMQFKRLIPVITTAVLVALIITTVNLFPGWFGNDPSFNRLLINPAYAQDNFSVVPTEGDTLGVEDDTSFVISSKQEIDPALLLESITVEPAVEFDFEQVGPKEFKVTPVTNLAEKGVYHVKIAASYIAENGLTMSKNYSWAFQVKDEFKILSTLPGDLSTNVPLNSGIEVTFSHEYYKGWEDAFSISPEVPGRFEKHHRVLTFIPDKPLKPETIYTVTMTPDLVVEGAGKVLTENYTFSFETTNEEVERDSAADAFQFKERFLEFSSTQAPIIPLRWHQLEAQTANVTIYRMPSDQQYLAAIDELNSVPAWSYYAYNNAMVSTKNLPVEATVETAVAGDTYSKYLVLPTLPAGKYLVEGSASGVTRQALLQVSDIASYVEVTKTDTIVWVNDIVTDKPVADAKVSVAGSQFTAKTNNGGVAVFDSNDINTAIEGRNLFLHVVAGNRSVFVPLNQGNLNALEDPLSWWTYLYTDRTLYQANDTVRVWGVIQARDKSPLPETVRVEIRSIGNYDDYNESIPLAEKTLVVNNTGAYVGSLELQNVTPGYYTMSVFNGDQLVDSTYIRVETYTKPAYQIEVVPDQEVIMAGDAISFKITSQFFEGTPVPHTALKYSFNGMSGTVITNAVGEAVVHLNTKKKACSATVSCQWPETETMVVSPVQTEIGEITGRAHVSVIPSEIDFNATVERADREMTITADLGRIQVDAIKANDLSFDTTVYPSDVWSGQTVHGNISRIEYVREETGTYYDFVNKVTRKKYDYNREVSDFASFDATTDAMGAVDFTFTSEPNSTYKIDLVVLADNGESQKITKYAYSGSEYFDPYSSGYYTMQLKNNQSISTTSFGLGDNVELEFVRDNVLLPKASSPQFLYLSHNNGLIDYEVSTSPEYVFKYGVQDVPSVQVLGVWFDGQGYHVGHLPWMNNAITYNDNEKGLDIAVSADKESYKPGDTVMLDIAVTDKQGKGHVSNVNVNLIDEAFYQLSEENPDPLDALYAVQPSGIVYSYDTHEYSSFLVPDGDAEGGGCFVAGAPIMMADGTTKPIEELVAGDKVLTFATERTEKLVSAEVLETYVHDVPGYMVINGRIKVTPEHKFFINRNWLEIGQAKIGDFMMNAAGELERITSIDFEHTPTTVYNFKVATYHTYIAYDMYVHNDKGGAPRVEFTDAAAFLTTTTNDQGVATITFTLPDNLTSWRVTTQAISPDLRAGVVTTALPVSKSMFVDVKMPTSVLLSDKPEIAVRAFGTALTKGNKVDFSIKNEEIPLETSFSGEAFESQYVSLSTLPVGSHDILFKGESAQDDDSLVLPLKVEPSRENMVVHDYDIAVEGQSLPENSADRTDVVLMDNNQGRFYYDLQSLRWTYGDRVDQKLARKQSALLLNEYFDTDYEVETVDFGDYQTADDGVSLLPYSGGELSLTAKAALVSPKSFDRALMVGYFYKVLSSPTSSMEEITWALMGLSAYQEPVLVRAQNIAAFGKLTPADALRLAYALYTFGDNSTAQQLYNSVLESYGESLDQYMRISLDGTDDQTLAATAMAAIVAAGLGDENQAALWQYVENNNGHDIVTNLDRLLYIKGQLPQLPAGASTFELTVRGETIPVSLERGQRYAFSVTAEELSHVTLHNIQGNVGVMTSYSVPVNTDEVAVNNAVQIDRRYFIDGKEVTSWKDTDIVEVRLYPSFTSDALVGNYQITDLLPSGMTIISGHLERSDEYSCNTWRPYEVNGESVNFWVYHSGNSNVHLYCGSYIHYFARVTAPGTYKAEPARIQSFNSSVMRNFSTEQTINITR